MEEDYGLGADEPIDDRWDDEHPDPFPNLDGHPYVHLSKTGSYWITPTKQVDGKTMLWYSICSHHRAHNTECETCQVGSWHEGG